MGASATAQINVRIDRELKEAGDRELERLGITPSQAVRALWEKFSEGGRGSEDARRALIGMGRAAGAGTAQKAKLAALDRFGASQRSFTQMLEDAGIDPYTFEAMEDEEVLEARYEHLLEKYGK